MIRGLWKSTAAFLAIAVAYPLFTHAAVPRNWLWVKGAVFVPTNCVNEAQEWDKYDSARNDRELHYASVYGFNCVRVFLHYFVYLKDKQKLLNNVEDFLTRADKYHIKVEFIFFDDCWNQPPKEILSKDYQYPAPIYGVHNSQWLQCPGDDVKAHYEQNRPQLQAYVQDIVNAHKADPRIAFWETYNEPNKSAGTIRILKNAEDWIHATGTKIPVTATGVDFSGGPYSDFISWHLYGGYNLKGGPDTLCTECMNREGMTVPGVVEHFRNHCGWELWEFGIGRDNCRFAWKQNRQSPATKENAAPFHGVVYPDGHPWSVDDVKAVMGTDAFAKAPLLRAEYYRDNHFGDLAKESVTPMIDFDLNDERGTNSIDPQADMPSDHFSVRYAGQINVPEQGWYRFYVSGNGGVKISTEIRQILAVDNLSANPSDGSVELPEGQHDITIEYAHDTGTASLYINWTPPGAQQTVFTPSSSGG
ncbi:MAG TPA: PA14 domain-containing protein [Tepidisphaeraceae bacterium]|jgi:hypothetical protein